MLLQMIVRPFLRIWVRLFSRWLGDNRLLLKKTCDVVICGNVEATDEMGVLALLEDVYFGF